MLLIFRNTGTNEKPHLTPILSIKDRVIATVNAVAVHGLMRIVATATYASVGMIQVHVWPIRKPERHDTNVTVLDLHETRFKKVCLSDLGKVYITETSPYKSDPRFPPNIY